MGQLYNPCPSPRLCTLVGVLEVYRRIFVYRVPGAHSLSPSEPIPVTRNEGVADGLPLWTVRNIVLFYTLRCPVFLPECPALCHCLNVGTGDPHRKRCVYVSDPLCRLAH